MKKILISFIIVFLFIALINSYSLAQNQKYSYIIGFWSDKFPVSDSVYGYVFFNDNKFLYYDENLYNIKTRYSGSTGKWKIENNKICIFPENDYFWKNDWVQDNNIYDPGDSNSLNKVDSIKKWTIIGDIRSYTENKFYIENNKKVFLKPANLFLKPIINGKIMDYQYSERSYWKLYDNPLQSRDVKRIKEEYEKL